MVTLPCLTRCCVVVLCAVITTLPFNAFAASFTAQVSSQQIELGKPLTLTLRSGTITTPLDTLALSTLQDNFTVKPLSAPATNKQTHQQLWQLRLYAYKPGTITIPSLSFAGNASKPIVINVTPAIDAKTQTAIALSSDITTTTPWYKQQVLVTHTFTTAAPIVVFDTPELIAANAKAIPLLVKREPVTTSTPALTRHTVGWAVFPLQHGNQIIELPAIAYLSDGVRTHLFYQKPLSLQVKPLPAYLPATIAVGKLQLTPRSYPGRFFFSQQLAEAQLQLTAQGMLAADIPLLTPQLRSSDTITVHPLTRLTQQTATISGMKSVADYRVPFSLRSQGLQQLPVLRVQYFDPDTGKIHSDEMMWPRLMVISPWLVAFIGVMTALLLLRSAGYLLNLLHRQWYCLQGYRHAVSQLATAITPQAIKQVLMSIAVAERWPANLTVQQWHNRWQIRHTRINFNITIVNELTLSLYRANSLDLYRARQTILNLCRSRWPYLSHLFSLSIQPKMLSR